ncbi:glucuronate isomerase [Pelomonas sp. SE-A7]|uniref:glucuronate isomerase n=1 Tax=Pelomonas sp. SE-A7 TaxID=3054953 RepID=UPI00259CCE15|nr:glucuronate isomerase [Pelomonas sp. SE-A7]MDM4765289.1 glucuronate isomerase [Pelomonas sp. SE-A7]
MSDFLGPDFLLDTATARQLFHEVAAGLPIIDYHSHLQQGEIAARKRFSSIAELWLAGDHYKWRLMRSAGIDEALVTGAAPDEDKFKAFCSVLPLAAGNPIHHWSHLELRRLFGIDLTINAANAPAIWKAANARLAEMDCWSLLDQARVEVACTTDDPADDLAQHAELANSALKTRVLPAYRPDQAMRCNKPEFIAYLQKLGGTAGVRITTFETLVEALAARVRFFHSQGGRISDHAIDAALPAGPVGPAQCEALFAKRFAGGQLTEAELGAYQRGLLHALGRVYAEHDWAMCLHIGAQRNNNRRRLDQFGPDTGYDSIADFSSSAGLAALLDDLDAEDRLPKTLLFNLNPAMSEVLSTLIGAFQDGATAGKLQYGPAWWFNDHKDGNLRQLQTLAAHGVLGTSVGMVTDSRSFASYPRHEYFRRLLCRQLGQWVEAGEYPDDGAGLAQIVRGVCYDNAKQYFGL